MGIFDKVSSLLPWQSDRRRAPVRPDALALRDDMDRWLARLMEEPWGALGATDVRERDDEVVVTANIPGLDRDDIQIELTPDALVIRGERHEEREDKRDNAVITERGERRFAWAVPLPAEVDRDRAEARVKNGVLTVRVPKSARGNEGARRIPIKAA